MSAVFSSALTNSGDGVKFSIDTRHLFKQLKKLDAELEKSIGDKAVNAGAKLYAKKMRKVIPLGTAERRKNVSGKKATEDRHLKRSIMVQKAKRSKARKIIQYRVGIIGWARAYAHIYEFGSKYVTGTRVFTKTLESSRTEILDAQNKKLRDELKKWGLS